MTSLSESPSITKASRTANYYDPSTMLLANSSTISYGGKLPQWDGQDDNAAAARRVNAMLGGATVGAMGAAAQAAQPQRSKDVALRVVKVLIADPDENLRLEDRLLYNGDEKVTDLTDQELYFELPIKELLDKHNEVRMTTLDKKATARAGKEVMLEPVRVRDLKMVVVDIAEF